MRSKQQIVTEMKGWREVGNQYLVKKCQRELDKHYPKTPLDEQLDKPMIPSFDDLKAMTVKELRQIAKDKGLKGYTKFREDDLINFLLDNW